MKKTLILMAAAASVVLAGCTESDLSSDTSLAKESAPSAIEFSASTGNAGVTRTVVAQDYQKGAIGNTADGDFTKSLKQAHFGVFAYHTTSGVYNPADVSNSPSNTAPNFMYNQELKFDDANSSGVNAWVYDPVKYWPNGVDAANAANNPSNTATEKNTEQKLSFFAYSPYMAMTSFTLDGSGAKGTDYPTAIGDDPKKFKTVATPTNGIVAMTTNEFTGNVWVKYLLPNAYENEAVDLLWGVRGQKIYSETDDGNNTVNALGDNYNINLTKQTVGEKVKFLFKHALTKISGQTVTSENVSETPGTGDKIGFKIVADVDVNTEATAGNHDNQPTYFGSDFDKTKTLITLKSIKIQDGKTATEDPETSVTGITTNSGIFNSGWFNIETGQWSNQEVTGSGSTISIVAKSDGANQTAADDVNYSINPDIREVENYSKSSGSGDKKLASGDTKWDDAQPTGISTTAVPVFAKENIPGIMLIPGAANQSIYITVDYVVRTADPNLKDGFTEVEQVISNKISLASLQSNKYYTIIMHLGLTSVKFEAVVADWVTNNATEFDEDGHVIDPATPTENESHIWLPSNVVYAKTTASPYAATKGGTSTVYTPANTTSYTINVSGLTTGRTVEVAYSGVASGATADPTTITDAGTTQVTVTLPANISNENKLSTITITEKNGDNVESTTIVNIIQNPV